MKSAAIRNQIEAALGDRFASPFEFRERYSVSMVSSGVPQLDALTGGLPRGALTEIFGPPSSGRTTLLLSTLAEMTARDEACALVDASDAFDPCSAFTAGVDLRRLLWVRCHNLEQALQAADLLLQAGGFGLLAVDLGDVTPRAAGRVPLTFWFRFQRVVENTPTALLVLEPMPYAKSCASLVLRLASARSRWSNTINLRLNGGSAISQSYSNKTASSHSSIKLLPDPAPQVLSPASTIPSHAWLLSGARFQLEVVRSRMQNQRVDSRHAAFETRLVS
jgi:hypothetical protein